MPRRRGWPSSADVALGCDGIAPGGRCLWFAPPPRRTAPAWSCNSTWPQPLLGTSAEAVLAFLLRAPQAHSGRSCAAPRNDFPLNAHVALTRFAPDQPTRAFGDHYGVG